jgi:hypothetical protein
MAFVAKPGLKNVLLYYLPAVCNAVLIIYLAWTASQPVALRHQQGFQTFALFYAMGGAVVAVSAITAFVQISSRQSGRRLLILALLNAIIPTVLLLLLLQVL